MSQVMRPPFPSPYTSSKSFPAWVMLALCVAATAIAWFGVSQSRQQDDQAHFELETMHTAAHIQNALASREQVLHQAAAIFANASVSHAAWRRYMASLALEKTFPEIQEIGFVMTSISGGDTATDATAPHGRWNNNNSSVHVTPLPPGRSAPNLPQELTSVYQVASRRTNTATPIDNVLLLQDATSPGQPMILLYRPVYVNNVGDNGADPVGRKLRGYVYARVAIGDFIKTILPQTDRQLRFKIFEGSSSDPQSLLYDSGNKASPDSIKFRKTAVIALNERPWTLQFESASAPPSDAIRADIYILGSGLFLALSLFGLMHALARSYVHRERKLVETERLASAARFQAFVEQLGGMPYIGKLDCKGSHLYVSPKVENLLGFTPEQWCNDPELRIRQLHELDRDDVLNAVASALSTQEPLSIDYRIRHNDGSVRWFHDEARVVADANGKPLFMQGVVLDITDRKQAQEELERSHKELKKLISALDALREEEQKRLAQEMHDDLGQLLGAMKMDLSVLAQHLPRNDAKDAKLLERLDNINDLVNAMVTSVRRIISDLPPKILDDAGLFEALELLGKNFEKRHQIKCRVHLPEFAPAFEQKTAASVYRMIQESLNNVAKHACATEVDIKMELTEKYAMLSIADNGKGFSATDLQKAGSFGLIGMRERVASLNGKIRIESADHAGATIYIWIPLDAKLTCDAELSEPTLIDYSI